MKTAALPPVVALPVARVSAPVASGEISRASLTPARKLDFSRMTSNELFSYVDEMILSGQMGADESTRLIHLALDAKSVGPDVPVNMYEMARGVIQFCSSNGWPEVAASYSTALEEMRFRETYSTGFRASA
jgi:hypothetical protein